MERPLLPSARAEAPPRFRRALALGCWSPRAASPRRTRSAARARRPAAARTRSRHRHHATTTGSSTVASAAQARRRAAGAGAQDVSPAVPAATARPRAAARSSPSRSPITTVVARSQYPWAKLIVEPYRATTLRALRAADAEDSSRHTYRWTVKPRRARSGAAAAAGAGTTARRRRVPHGPDGDAHVHRRPLVRRERRAVRAAPVEFQERGGAARPQRHRRAARRARRVQVRAARGAHALGGRPRAAHHDDAHDVQHVDGRGQRAVRAGVPRRRVVRARAPARRGEPRLRPLARRRGHRHAPRELHAALRAGAAAHRAERERAVLGVHVRHVQLRPALGAELGALPARLVRQHAGRRLAHARHRQGHVGAPRGDEQRAQLLVDRQRVRPAAEPVEHEQEPVRRAARLDQQPLDVHELPRRAPTCTSGFRV